MHTAKLLPSIFCSFVLSSYRRTLVQFVQKSHKPEVGSSSLPLDTTSIGQSKNKLNFVLNYDIFKYLNFKSVKSWYSYRHRMYVDTLFT